jgi:hypothetical protein
MEVVAYPEWLARLTRHVEGGGNPELRALVPLLTHPLPGGQHWIELARWVSDVSCAGTAETLAGSGVRCPALDTAYLSKLLLLARLGTDPVVPPWAGYTPGQPERRIRADAQLV